MKSVEGKRAWAVWWAVVGTLFLYMAAGGWIVTRMGGTGLTLPPMVTPVFFCLALLQTVGLFLLFPRVFAKTQNYLTYCLLRWALAETIGIYGLLLFLGGAALRIFAVLLAWSLALLVVLKPTESDFDRFNLARR